MFNPMDHPVFLLLFSLPVFWFSAWLGASFRRRQRGIQESTRSDLTFVLGGAMTLLGLIIGFTYSMAVTRYDQRKNYEEEEANAIGTEYVRADYLPSAEAAKIRALLKNYLYQRILYYEAGQGEKLSEIVIVYVALTTPFRSGVGGAAKQRSGLPGPPGLRPQVQLRFGTSQRILRHLSPDKHERNQDQNELSGKQSLTCSRIPSIYWLPRSHSRPASKYRTQ